MINYNHFRTNLTSEESRALFKSSVNFIDISISSYCNRKCPYCPNATIPSRQTDKFFMNDGLFLRIMQQLSLINYSGAIQINRYNEPLSDRDYVINRIREIHCHLPAASINIFTNCDYLDRDYLLELIAAGTTSILGTVHTTKVEDSVDDRLLRMRKTLSRIGFPYQIDQATTQQIVVSVNCGIPFKIGAHDFYARNNNGVMMMHDRGESLPVNRGYRREKPCWTTFTGLGVEWDGRILPCCEIQPDAYPDDRYVLGVLDESSDLFLTWCNPSYVAWRKAMFSYQPKSSPCSTCPMGEQEDSAAEEMRPLVERWRTALGLS